MTGLILFFIFIIYLFHDIPHFIFYLFIIFFKPPSHLNTSYLFFISRINSLFIYVQDGVVSKEGVEVKVDIQVTESRLGKRTHPPYPTLRILEEEGESY